MQCGRTALILASKNNHLSIVQILLKDRRADVNMKDNAGWTALMWAAFGGHLDVVQALLGQDIDANMQNEVRPDLCVAVSCVC